MIFPVKYDLKGYRKFGRVYSGEKKIHLGHDFNVHLGEETFSIDNGIVKEIQWSNGFGGWDPSLKGWFLWIEHGNVCALYGHCKPFNLSIGNYVKKGQLIGHIHDYIRSRQHLPHLHFGLWNGTDYPMSNLGYDINIKKWIDPKKYILERA